MQIVVEHISHLPNAAQQVVQALGDSRVVLFYGDMGAGKTTLIKAICTALGVAENVSSPTFSIVNEYESPHGPVYHFDFYRLREESEALDMGYEEYLYSGAYCLIEWPEKIVGLLPEDACKVMIEVSTDEKRKISIF